MENSYQNSTTSQIIDAIINQLSFEGESKSDIADILLSILNQTPYEKEPSSVIAELFIKLKAKIEGESFEPFDKPYISNIAEIIKSILDETEYNNAPNSRIAELLLELKEQLEENFTELTASGAIASFETNVSKPIVNLTAYVKATQEAGTPTPQNPKAISGVSELSIKHSGSDMTDYDEYIVNLGGTYYGGYVSQDKDGKRELVVTHKAFVFTGSESWQVSTTFFYLPAGTLEDIPIQAQTVCSNGLSINSMTNKQIRLYPSYGINSQYISMSSTVSELQEYLSNGIQFLYELAEPFTIALPDGQPIMAYEGSNNIWNDSSDSEVTYLYKGQPETANMLSSNNDAELFEMDTENNNQEE